MAGKRKQVQYAVIIRDYSDLEDYLTKGYCVVAMATLGTEILAVIE